MKCFYCGKRNVKTLDSFVKINSGELQGYFCNDCKKYFLGEITKKTRQTFL